MHWLSAPPPRFPAHFESPLTPRAQTLAISIVSTLRARHSAQVVQVKSVAPNYRGLAVVAEMGPEIGEYYHRLTRHQMKTVVIVDDDIIYETPHRDGYIMIKGRGWKCETTHVGYCDGSEAEKFPIFGTATLAVVIKHGGAMANMHTFMEGMASALAHQRVERMIIVTDGQTNQQDWIAAHEAFAEHGLTIGYSTISLPALL